MSASRHAWPRLAAAALSLLAGAACGGGGGGGTDIPSPVVLSVLDESGTTPVTLVFSGDRERVIIKGNNFLATATGNTHHRAIVDGLDLTGWRPGVAPEPAIVEVDQVQWVDSHTLRAVIPAGLDAGSKTLTVVNAYGKQGSLANAFAVQTTAGAALAVDLTLTPGTVNVGQTLTVQVAVKNAGSAAATGVVASLKLSSTNGAAGRITAGPDPASVATLAPGDTSTFSWAIAATGAGTLAVEADAQGQDMFSNLPVSSAPVSKNEVVQAPAGLTATIVAANPVDALRHSVDVGQAISVTFSVQNGGTATADLTSVALSPTGTATGVTCTGPTPAMPQSVGAGEKRDFAFSCRATGAGVLQIGGNVAGTDHTSHAPLSDAATPDTISVQAPPALTAALTRDRATISLGQSVSVTLTISNAGGGSATLTRAPVPTAAVGTDQTKVSCGAPSPASLLTVPGGGSVTYTWTCAPISTGTLNLGAQVSTSDDNTRLALAQVNAPNVTVAVQNPANLVAVTGVTGSTTVDVGQPVSVTFNLINGGAAAADIASVTPTVDPTSAVTATCTAPLRNGLPFAPFSIPGGSNAVLTWTCTPGAPAVGTSATLVLSGAVVATDHNSGGALAPTVTTFSLTVQTAASVTSIALDASPSTVDTGQSSAISLTLRNSGGATARVTITTTASPATGVTCGPTPTPAQPIAGMGTLVVGWTCSSTAAGAHAYGANVTAVDVNNGASASVPVTAAPVLVQTPASLSASYSVHPSSADTSQQATFTLHVANAGDATANVSTVTPVPLAGLSCGPVTPAPSTINIAGHASRDFTFACSAAAVGSYTLGATVAAADANNGGSADATAANVVLAVQTPAALTATLAASAAAIDVGHPVNLALTVTNAAGAGSALVSAVVPGTTTAAVTCPAAPTEALPATIAGGGSATFHWACTGAAGGTPTLGATVTATAVNTTTGLSTPVAGVPITVDTPAVLAATLTATPATISVNHEVDVSLLVSKTGTATAHVTAVSATLSGVAGTCATPSATAFDLTTASPSRTITWTCTPAAAGAATMGAAVAANDANISGSNIGPTVTGVPVTVQTAGQLTVSIAATPTTADTVQAVPVTATFTNNGGAAATVSALAGTIGPVTGSCGSYSQTGLTVPTGGAPVTVTWSCSATTTGGATLGATMTAIDANSVAITPTITTDALTIQSPASLTGTLAPAMAPAGPVTITLTLTNVGGATARVTAASLAVTAGATVLDCSAAARSALPDIAGGGSGQVTWTPCTAAGTTGASATVHVAVTDSDLNTGTEANPTVPDLPFGIQ